MLTAYLIGLALHAAIVGVLIGYAHRKNRELDFVFGAVLLGLIWPVVWLVFVGVIIEELIASRKGVK